MVRIISAMSQADPMNQVEVERFLRDSKSPLKLGTIDRQGDPVIHPLWYLYDQDKFYMITASDSLKMKNMLKQGPVYFCVDTETRPYKGVKGKGNIAKVADRDNAVRIGEKIITKYMGGVQNPLGKFLIRRLKEGKETLLEITPSYYSVWDDSKSP